MSRPDNSLHHFTPTEARRLRKGFGWRAQRSPLNIIVTLLAEGGRMTVSPHSAAISHTKLPANGRAYAVVLLASVCHLCHRRHHTEADNREDYDCHRHKGGPFFHHTQAWARRCWLCTWALSWCGCCWACRCDCDTAAGVMLKGSNQVGGWVDLVGGRRKLASSSVR